MSQPTDTKSIGTPFIELQSVDSTNNYARRQIHNASLPDSQGLSLHGMAIFAHEQYAGKGQRGKIWHSEKGANIALSIILKPQPLLLSQQFMLNACIAVAIHDFFMKYAGDDTKIKWPNDLYWQDRKAGGVLIESIVGSKNVDTVSQQPATDESNSVSANWNWSIVGIGININQAKFSDELPNPVSLKQITGKNHDTVNLAKELCELLDKKFKMLINNGFEKIYATYLSNLYKKNERVRLKKGNRVFEATILSVSPSGKLMVSHSIDEEFNFGEIEWMI